MHNLNLQYDYIAKVEYDAKQCFQKQKLRQGGVMSDVLMRFSNYSNFAQ